MHIECTEMLDCYQKAATACPAGYDVLDTGVREELTASQRIGHAMQAAGHSIQQGHSAQSCQPGATCVNQAPAAPRGVQVREYLVRCREREAQRPRSAESQAQPPQGEREDDPSERPKTTAAKELLPQASGPPGVSGFMFGATMRQAQSACSESGAVWTAENDVYTCSKMPWSLGITGVVSFAFCAAQLCRIELVTPEDVLGNDSLRAVLKIRQLLVEKYGRPTETRQAIPEACGSDVGPCLVEGTATLEYIWTFAGKKAINVGAKKEGKGARVRLVYDHDSQDRSRGL